MSLEALTEHVQLRLSLPKSRKHRAKITKMSRGRMRSTGQRLLRHRRRSTERIGV